MLGQRDMADSWLGHRPCLNGLDTFFVNTHGFGLFSKNQLILPAEEAQIIIPFQ